MTVSEVAAVCLSDNKKDTRGVPYLGSDSSDLAKGGPGLPLDPMLPFGRLVEYLLTFFVRRRRCHF